MNPQNFLQSIKHPFLLMISVFVVIVVVGGVFWNNQSEPINLRVTEQYCVVDADCTFVASDCEDCKYEAISKERLQSFLSAKQKFCAVNPPEAVCDMIFTGKVQCIANKCEITE